MAVKDVPDQDQRRARDPGGTDQAGDGGKGATDDPLVRPAGAVDDHNRTLAAIMRRQRALDEAQVPDREMDGEGGAGQPSSAAPRPAAWR
jgi:hypothetical protein